MTLVGKGEAVQSPKPDLVGILDRRGNRMVAGQMAIQNRLNPYYFDVSVPGWMRALEVENVGGAGYNDRQVKTGRFGFVEIGLSYRYI